jgi:alpha-tubulin suppressor-like RCC1 family protein
MIPVNSLITKLNSAIATGGLTSLELAQVFGAIESIEKSGIGVVTATLNLPPAANNKGRFVYITSESKYVYSNGITWDINNILRFPDANGYAWGTAVYGRLGDGTTVAKSSPVSVIGGFTDWVQLNAGSQHSFGIRANGTAWAWGAATSGKLGDGTTVSKSSPVSVAGGYTDWVQVSAGATHSLGLRANGTAWAWGAGTNGRLGDNTAVAKSAPVSVAGGFIDWVQVSAGAIHSLGVRANGTAWAWGSGASGILGDNTTVSKSSPVLVVGGFTDWIQVSAGATHSLGLRANGTAWAWGPSTNGRLGDGTIVSKLSPVSVVGGFTDWIQVSAGGLSSGHSVGLRANGTAWAWGYNTNGQLGDGTVSSRTSPVSVVGGFTDWVQVNAGTSNSVGLRANGTAWAWGAAILGDNTAVGKLSPVSIVGSLNWVQISTNVAHMLGIKA